MVIVKEEFYWTIKICQIVWTLSLFDLFFFLSAYFSLQLQEFGKEEAESISKNVRKMDVSSFLLQIVSLIMRKKSHSDIEVKIVLTDSFSFIQSHLSLPLFTLSYFVVIPLPFLIKLFTFFISFPFFLTVSPSFLSKIYHTFIFAQYVFLFSSLWHNSLLPNWITTYFLLV